MRKRKHLIDQKPSLIWFILVDAATGKSYKGTTADKVSLSPGTVIAQFRKAVKLKHSNKLSYIDAADLLVYKNMSSFEKRKDVEEKEEPLEEDSLIDGLGKSKKEALIVVVQHVIDQGAHRVSGGFTQGINNSYATKSQSVPRNQWKISTIAQLSYDPASIPFLLDSNYLAKTGLPTDKLILYCRPTFHEQFQFLSRRVIDNSVLGWILGPPGTGKSTTALAFASTLDKKDWIVTWIHLYTYHYPVCVRLQGDSKISRDIYDNNMDELFDILEEVDESKQHIVFIDGYTQNGRKHNDVQQACYSWLEKDRGKRRLVVVCSMSSRLSKMQNDMMLNLEEFFVNSWKENEYLDAIQNEEFLKNVKSVLDTDFGMRPPASPQDLVRSKFYFAGGSARWMFRLRTINVMEEIKLSVDTVKDIIAHLKGAVEDLSNSVVNRLFSPSITQDIIRSVSIVSQFVGICLAIKAGPELIRHLTPGYRHPSMDGWMLEMWFFASLSYGGVKSIDDSSNEVHFWPESYVRTFDIAYIPFIPDNGGVWLKLNKRNQGGFDAIFIDKGRGLVRFVQVVVDASHSFKLEYFHSFLTALDKSSQYFGIASVEIIFLVHYKKLDMFKIATPTGQGLLSEFGWEKGKEREKAKIFGILGWEDSI